MSDKERNYDLQPTKQSQIDAPVLRYGPPQPRQTVEAVPTRGLASRLGQEEFLRVHLGQVGDGTAKGDKCLMGMALCRPTPTRVKGLEAVGECPGRRGHIAEEQARRACRVDWARQKPR